jgi:diaminohydroxyphosphoribosylaminopyrimidine deaminase/5-amino-6-(5-phosphoribosylamino)uracil reductase
LNEAFEKHVTTGMPFVTLKMASSLDGKAAASDGSSRWITGEEARADVQRLRAGADAVVVGAGTAVADDPALTVRDPRYSGARQPLRVVVDSGGRVDAAGNLFDGSAPTIVATTDRAPGERLARWEKAGAEVVVVDADGAGGVSVRELAAALGKRDVQSMLVEGGPTLAWSFVRDDMVDKVVMYLAPILVGGVGAASAIVGAGFTPIGSARRVDVSWVGRVGEDLKVEAYVHRDS